MDIFIRCPIFKIKPDVREIIRIFIEQKKDFKIDLFRVKISFINSKLPLCTLLQKKSLKKLYT